MKVVQGPLFSFSYDAVCYIGCLSAATCDALISFFIVIWVNEKRTIDKWWLNCRRGLALVRMRHCRRGRSANLLWGPVWWPMGAALIPLPPALRGPVHICRFDKFRRGPHKKRITPYKV